MTDSVYRERACLVAHLATKYPSHIGYNDANEPLWQVVTMETPTGQMTWHIAPQDSELFRHVRDTLPSDQAWDGHSTEEKYGRLRQLTAWEVANA
jgi:hypothetical protein